MVLSLQFVEVLQGAIDEDATQPGRKLRLPPELM
jgi:hypothetical protein